MEPQTTTTPEEFERRVQIVAADLKKGIPERSVFTHYHTLWFMPLKITESYLAEAKKRNNLATAAAPSPLPTAATTTPAAASSPPPPATATTPAAASSPPPPAATPCSPPDAPPKSSWKISDEEFLPIMLEHGRIKYGKIANAIREKYGVSYSRQAAKERATKLSIWHPALQIDKMTKLSEKNLLNSLEKEGEDTTKTRVAMFVLDKLRKKRRPYTSTGNEMNEWEDLKREVFKIGDKIITFD